MKTGSVQSELKKGFPNLNLPRKPVLPQSLFKIGNVMRSDAHRENLTFLQTYSVVLSIICLAVQKIGWEHFKQSKNKKKPPVAADGSGPKGPGKEITAMIIPQPRRKVIYPDLARRMKRKDIRLTYFEISRLINRGVRYVAARMIGDGDYTIQEAYTILENIGEKPEAISKYFPRRTS